MVEDLGFVGPLLQIGPDPLGFEHLDGRLPGHDGVLEHREAVQVHRQTHQTEQRACAHRMVVAQDARRGGVRVAAVPLLEDAVRGEQAQDPVERAGIGPAGRRELAHGDGFVVDAVGDADLGDDLQAARRVGAVGERVDHLGGLLCHDGQGSISSV